MRSKSQKGEKIQYLYPVKSISLASQQEVEKSKKYNIFSKYDHFDIPPRGGKVEKYKNSNIFSKINHLVLPARGRKVKKSKKLNIFSKIDHFYPPLRGQKVKKLKKTIYSVKSISFQYTCSVKSIILPSHQLEVKKTKSRKKSI